ncbi:hypothetical protein K435DRAFT_873039 [Dendrothele bispora CBS 962.96]|uniref:Uncharacterized protein n=1 Tax=Dendrothele bispora (strain CBS 962.96) TaxID=1314807 RepID=A0A4S8L189_DENBC|nr:hypothetical protein K435DRAFT_873039 [Dendrothele bispora CBS 962.96]
MRRPCAKKHCSCGNFNGDNTSPKCSSCSHKASQHVSVPDDSDSDNNNNPTNGLGDNDDSDEPIVQEMLQNVVSSPIQPVAPKQSIHTIVSREMSSATAQYLMKAGVELNKGLKPPPKVDAYSSCNSSLKASRKKPKKSSGSMAGASSSSDSVKAVKVVAGIIFNIHGLQESGGLDLNMNKVWNQTSIDYYKKLGLAAIDTRNGIQLDLRLDHKATIASIASYIPLFNAMYPAEDDVHHAPWVLCSQFRNNLSVMPEPHPTMADLFNKRSHVSKNFQNQYIYLCTRQPIPKEVVQKHSKLSSLEFDTWWGCLAKFENWESTLNMGYVPDSCDNDSNTEDLDTTPKASGSRKRRHHHSVGSDSEQPPLRRSSRFASVTTTEKQPIVSSKRKGKERAINDDSSDGDVSASDSQPEFSPVPLAKRFDPWRLDRKFAF